MRAKSFWHLTTFWFSGSGHAQGRQNPPLHHDLVTPVHGFENRGPGHRSITAGGKKVPILHRYFYENTGAKTHPKKRSDLSVYGHKFDLFYCQWNTRQPIPTS